MCCNCTKTRAKVTWALLECLFFSGLLSGWYLVISQMKAQDFFGSNCANVSSSNTQWKQPGFDIITSKNDIKTYNAEEETSLDVTTDVEKPENSSGLDRTMCFPPLYQLHKRLPVKYTVEGIHKNETISQVSINGNKSSGDRRYMIKLMWFKWASCVTWFTNCSDYKG